MGATYEKVEADSVKNTLYERAAVIIEVERIHMPWAQKRSSRLTSVRRRLTEFVTRSKGAVHPQPTVTKETTSDREEDALNFPDWLHVLRRKKNWKVRGNGADIKGFDAAATKSKDQSSIAGTQATDQAAEDVHDSLGEIGSQLTDVQESIMKLNEKHKRDVRELHDMVQTLILRQQGHAALTENLARGASALQSAGKWTFPQSVQPAQQFEQQSEQQISVQSLIERYKEGQQGP